MRYIYHHLFWISHVMVIVSSGWSVPPEMKTMWFSAQIFQLLLVIVMFYVNIQLFIPRYYRQKKYGAYILWGLLTIFLAYLLYACFIQFLTTMPYNMFTIDQFAEVNIRMLRLFLTSFFLGLTDDWVAQQRRLSDMQVEKLRAELNYLRGQVNPHFLFNTLNNLYGLALEKSDKTPIYILKLSDMMDYILFESNEEQVLLSEDVKNLQHYIDIEQLRQVDPSKISFFTEGGIKDQKIAPLLFLPLVENAIKHGLNRSVNEGFAKIRLKITEQTVECWVENNVNPHYHANESEKKHGIGLQNLQRRLDLFYPQKHVLTTSKTDTHFKAYLKLHING
jgi:two-component system, LytTR family, sensor kinase